MKTLVELGGDIKIVKSSVTIIFRMYAIATPTGISLKDFHSSTALSLTLVIYAPFSQSVCDFDTLLCLPSIELYSLSLKIFLHVMQEHLVQKRATRKQICGSLRCSTCIQKSTFAVLKKKHGLQKARANPMN